MERRHDDVSTHRTKLYAIQPRDAEGRDQHKWVWKLYATQAGAVRALVKMGGGKVHEVHLVGDRALRGMLRLLDDALAGEEKSADKVGHSAEVRGQGGQSADVRISADTLGLCGRVGIRVDHD